MAGVGEARRIEINPLELRGAEDILSALKPILEGAGEGVKTARVRLTLYRPLDERIDTTVFDAVILSGRAGITLRALKNRVRRLYADALRRNQSLVYKVRKQYVLRQLKRMYRSGLILVENEEPFREMLKALRKKDAEKLGELWEKHAGEVIVKPRVETIKSTCIPRTVKREVVVVKEGNKVTIKRLFPEPLTIELPG